MLFAICISSLEKYLDKSFAHLKISHGHFFLDMVNKPMFYLILFFGRAARHVGS